MYKALSTRRAKVISLMIVPILLLFLAITLRVANAPSGQRQTNTTSQAQSTSNYTLDFSTYIGSAGYDSVRDVATDSQGNIYITGGTSSTNFPQTLGPAFNSGACSTLGSGGRMDIFITKYSSAGQRIWSRLLGGPCYDRAYAIEVDNTGVYVGGRAGAGFPTTAGVVQPSFGGDASPNSLYGHQDGIIAKLPLDGSSVLWATYFGGNDLSFFRDIAVDNGGNVYGAVTGVSSSNPHIKAGAYQTSLQGGQDGVITKITPDGTQVAWATYFGGSGTDMGVPSIRVDHQGNAVVAGMTNSSNLPTTAGAYDQTYNGNGDMHVTKFTTQGQLVFSSYLGGSQGDGAETHNLAVDNQGNIIVAATTQSTNFPTTAGAYQRTYGGSGGSSTGANTNYPGDGYIAKLSADGSSLLASTYLGGSQGEGIEGVGVDNLGNIVVGGATYSTNFPVSAGAHQSTNRGGGDFFATKLSPMLDTLIYSTYLGGSGTDYGRTAHSDSAGNLFVAGESASANWPTRNAAQNSFMGGGTDGALAKISLSSGGTPVPTVQPIPTATPSYATPTFACLGACSTPTVTPKPTSTPTPTSSIPKPSSFPTPTLTPNPTFTIPSFILSPTNIQNTPVPTPPVPPVNKGIIELLLEFIKLILEMFLKLLGMGL